jgi:hypothetical protein
VQGKRDPVIRGLTLKHPWTWAVLELGKNIENRQWQPPLEMIGQHIAIHGGVAPTSRPAWNEVREDVSVIYEGILRKLPQADQERLRDYFAREFPGKNNHKGTEIVLEEVIRPGIVAVVRLENPVPCRGAQKLWTLPDDVLERVRTEYRLGKAKAQGTPSGTVKT